MQWVPAYRKGIQWRDSSAVMQKPVLDAGKRAGHLVFEDAETAFRTFFGLVARDVQIRLLLGDWPGLTEAAIEADAARATQQFLALYGQKPGRTASDFNGKE